MMKNHYAYSLVLLVMLTLAMPRATTKVFLAGDSTICLYEKDRLPMMGWGMPFAAFFDSTIIIENRARGGRSTRTFMREGRWKTIVDELSEGDFVLIQFGHNDEAKEEKYKDRYTPVPDYKSNLVRMILETTEKKAHPVIITPVSRLRFDGKGNALETHKEYTAAAIEVAAAHHVPLIDLDTKSRMLYQEMGPQAASFLFVQLDSLQHPNYPAGLKDNTHFSEYGARRISELVLAGIRTEVPELARHIIIRAPKK